MLVTYLNQASNGEVGEANLTPTWLQLAQVCSISQL